LGFFSRRWRLPATAFTLAGLLGWVLNLDGLVASAGVRSFVLRSSLGELWLRDPHRFRYLLPIAVATLAGYGVQGWLDLPSRPTLARTAKRALWWVPSLVVLVVAPLIAGSKPGSYLPLLLGAVVAAPLLLTAASGRGWARAALPVVTAAELVIVALVTQPGVARPTPQLASGVDRGLGHAFPVLHAPTIRPAAYLAPGPIAATIRANAPLSRYLTFDPATSANPANPRGFLSYQQPPDWPADENGRSVLFGLNEVQGYSPVQLFPYWSLVRRVDRRAPIFYNAAHLQRLDPAVLELFGVGWIIEPTGLRPRPDGDRVATEGRYSLYRLSSPTPRASLVFRWRRVPPATGLDAVLSHGFDARREAIVAPAHQATPPVPPAATPKHARASATYQQLSPDHVRVRVSVSAAALLVVRNAYDRNWSATVDGAPAPVFVADYLMQGVPVPSGTHVVELRYRDRPAEVGLVTSAAAWLILIVLILVMTKAGRSSQRRKRDPAAHSGPPL